jgi:hypothetical protein
MAVEVHMPQERNTRRKNQDDPSERKGRANMRVYVQSELGRDLYKMSMEYQRDGGRLLTDEEIEDELILRRGGYVQKDVV